MSEVQSLDRAILRESRDFNYDLELQHQRTILTRHRRVLKIPNHEWFEKLYLNQKLNIAHLMAESALFASLYARIMKETSVETKSIPASTAGASQSARSIPKPISMRKTHNTITLDQEPTMEYYNEDIWTPKSRRQSYAQDRSTTSTFVAPDARADEHRARRHAIEKYIDPLLPLAGAPRNRFVLVCWGKSDQCYIRSVFFQSRSSEPASIEPVIWRSVRHAWFSSNSPLHRFLRYFRTIKNVDIVTVSFHMRIR